MKHLLEDPVFGPIILAAAALACAVACVCLIARMMAQSDVRDLGPCPCPVVFLEKQDRSGWELKKFHARLCQERRPWPEISSRTLRVPPHIKYLSDEDSATPTLDALRNLKNGVKP